MNKLIKYSFLFLLSSFILFNGCTKTSDKVIDQRTGVGTDNPYKNSDTAHTIKVDVKIDSTSFLGLQEYIFSKKCAQPGCHDGNFEPDYRTVESSYNSLVYHACVKNQINGVIFRYRVAPGQVDSSWLYTRVTTKDAVLGRMPLYSSSLTEHELWMIRTWIKNGAKDAFDQSPKLANPEPQFYGLYGQLPDFSNYRVDTLRGGLFINPMKLPKNTNVEFYIGLYDDKTYPFSFNPAYVMISSEIGEFTSYKKIDLIKSTTPKYYPYFLSKQNQTLPYYLSFKINTGDYALNKIQFMRFVVQDADHNVPTTLPVAKSSFQLQTYFSFIVN